MLHKVQKPVPKNWMNCYFSKWMLCFENLYEHLYENQKSIFILFSIYNFSIEFVFNPFFLSKPVSTWQTRLYPPSIVTLSNKLKPFIFLLTHPVQFTSFPVHQFTSFWANLLKKKKLHSPSLASLHAVHTYTSRLVWLEIKKIHKRKTDLCRVSINCTQF